MAGTGAFHTESAAKGRWVAGVGRLWDGLEPTLTMTTNATTATTISSMAMSHQRGRRRAVPPGRCERLCRAETRAVPSW